MTLDMLRFGIGAAECSGKADQPLALQLQAHLHGKKSQNTKLNGKLIKRGTSGILMERLNF